MRGNLPQAGEFGQPRQHRRIEKVSHARGVEVVPGPRVPKCVRDEAEVTDHVTRNDTHDERRLTLEDAERRLHRSAAVLGNY